MADKTYELVATESEAVEPHLDPWQIENLSDLNWALERMAACKSMHEFDAQIKNDIPEALKKEMTPTFYAMTERLAGEGDKDAEHACAMRDAKKNDKETT